MENFEELNLNGEIIRALKEMGFVKPTEVQELTIPIALEGKDIIVRSKTGSGKTAAFAIPIIEKVNTPGPQALVIAPTRELALQIEDVFKKIGKYSHSHTAIVYGGVSINPQAERVRRGANVIVGTPGRIIDLMERGMLDFRNIKFLVLDEADIMLEMGFIDDIKYIIEKLPEKRQMMLFSATMPRKIKEVAYEYMHEMKTLEVGGEEEFAVKQIENIYTIVNRSYKFSILLGYLEHYKPKKAIIFSKTQRSTEVIYHVLKDNGFNPVMLHGGMTQVKREYAMQDFRNSPTGILIATNVAARGIDIVDISDVINFDEPDDPSVYLHRTGRSARMGREGRAFTMVERQDSDLIYAIEKFAGIKFRRIEVDTSKFSNINFGKYFGSRREDEEGGSRFRRGYSKSPRSDAGHFHSSHSDHRRPGEYGGRSSDEHSRPHGGYKHFQKKSNNSY